MSEPSPTKVAVVIGTRPEAVKLAPVVHALAADPGFHPLVVAAAQHRDMLDPVLDFFGLTADRDLDVFSPGQTLTDVATRVMTRLDGVIAEAHPDAVVVQGDTTTTMAAALAAFHRHVPVAHVEAGLRTGNRTSPFPEEVNRRLTAVLGELHLAPTATARDALLAEAVPRRDVVVTGNTVIDALQWAVPRADAYRDPALAAIDGDPRRVVLVTMHRRESWGERMRAVGRALGRLAAHDPELLVVLPLHLNPGVRAALTPSLEGLDNVVLTEPVPYGEFVRLLHQAHLVVTDSGGLQEEAPSLGKPVLVCRDTTERPEAVRAGTARLVGTDEDRIVGEARRLLYDREAYESMARATNPYGDGRAAARIVDALRHRFRAGPPAEEWRWQPGDVRSDASQDSEPRSDASQDSEPRSDASQDSDPRSDAS